MAGELVSLTQQSDALAHSVNRRVSSLLNRPVHRCVFRLTFSWSSETLGEVLDFDGNSARFYGMTIPSSSWVIAGNIENATDSTIELANVTSRSGTATDDSFVVGDSTYYRCWWLRALTWNGTKVWYLEEDVTDNNAAQILHSAWIATRRTALAQTTASGTTGTLTFSPVAKSDYVSWWESTADGSFTWLGTGHPFACGTLSDWPFASDIASNRVYHAYAERGAPTCAVEIVSQ